MTAELPPELRRAIEEAVHRATDVVERFGNRMTRLERSIPRLLPPDQEAAEERR